MQISLRKLAAIEILLLGTWLIVAEYAGGVLLCAALGLFVLHRSHGLWQLLLGAYLLCLGINYVPLLAYALIVRNKANARQELGDELADVRKAMSRYRTQSLVLLVPLFVPVLIFMQGKSVGRHPR